MCSFIPSFTVILITIFHCVKRLDEAHKDNGFTFKIRQAPGGVASASTRVAVPTATATVSEPAEIPMGIIVTGSQVQPTQVTLGGGDDVGGGEGDGGGGGNGPQPHVVAVGAAVGAEASGDEKKTLAGQLSELKEALASGLVTQEEHDLAKRRIITEMTSRLDV